MPWASQNRVSHDKFAGAIEISEQQYSDGVAAMVAGKRISISNGFFQILGTAIPDAPPSPITIDDVAVERERRLALGFGYTFPEKDGAADPRGIVQIGTTDEDMKGWDEVTTLAQAYINTEQPTTAIEISAISGKVFVTATEWQFILIAAGNFRQPIWQASFLLQAMDPIPADYADDNYWPS